MYKPSPHIKFYDGIFNKQYPRPKSCGGKCFFPVDFPNPMAALQMSHAHPIYVPETPYGHGEKTVPDYKAANANYEQARHYAVRRGLPAWAEYETRYTWI